MKKEGWPRFPYSHWDSVKKWNISSLRLIALRLEEKGSSSRTQSGYRGDTSDGLTPIYVPVFMRA